MTTIKFHLKGLVLIAVFGGAMVTPFVVFSSLIGTFLGVMIRLAV